MQTKVEKLHREQIEITKRLNEARRRAWIKKSRKMVGTYYGHVCRDYPAHLDDHEYLFYKITGRIARGKSYPVVTAVGFRYETRQLTHVEFFEREFCIEFDEFMDEISKQEWEERYALAMNLLTAIAGRKT